MENKGYKGNGLAFYKALRSSDKSSEEVRIAMKVSNGTFYRMLKKEVWTDYEKELAGKALDLDWHIMFGLKPNDVPTSNVSGTSNSAADDDNQGNGTTLGDDSVHSHKPSDMKNLTEAVLIIAESNRELTAMLREERTENAKLRASLANGDEVKKGKAA